MCDLVYVVVVEDYDDDTKVIVFKDKEIAIIRADIEVKALGGVHPENLGLTDQLKKEGYVYNTNCLHSSGNVSVIKMTVN